MTCVFQKDFNSGFSFWNIPPVSFLWVLGLVSGMILQLCSGGFFPSLMLGIPLGSVSIVSLFTSVFLPFLFSAFAVYISQPLLLHFIAFWKAFAFSFVSTGMVICFGSSGWLIRLLLMFSDWVTMPILFWYLHCHDSSAYHFSGIEFFVICVLILCIGSFDYVYILPFMAGMINS